MGFVVLHMEKAHGSDSGTTAHIERSIIPKNADPTRTHLNRRLIEYPDGVKDRSAAIQRRLEEAGLTRKVGSKVRRLCRHGNNLHPHASGSILPMNLASDSPKRKSLRKRKRPPRQPTTKGKNNKGSL